MAWPGLVNLPAEKLETGVIYDIDMKAKMAIVSPLRRFNEEEHYGICELG
jgi:hypothetical protein